MVTSSCQNINYNTTTSTNKLKRYGIELKSNLNTFTLDNGCLLQYHFTYVRSLKKRTNKSAEICLYVRVCVIVKQKTSAMVGHAYTNVPWGERGGGGTAILFCSALQYVKSYDSSSFNWLGTDLSTQR